MQPIAELIKHSLLFPVIQSVHLMGLTVLVGAVAMLDFRLLGLALPRHSPAKLASVLAPWTLAGLAAIAVTGPLMFWADAGRYARNPAFLLKMIVLAVALVWHFTLHRHAAFNGNARASGPQKAAAAFSLTLWSSVLLAGRAIADFDLP